MVYYLSQLYDGKMLVYNESDDTIYVEVTGYPYKPCSYKDFNGNQNTLLKFLDVYTEYDCFDYSSLVKFILTLEGNKYSLQDFKSKLVGASIKGLHFSLDSYSLSSLADSEFIKDCKVVRGDFRLSKSIAVVSPKKLFDDLASIELKHRGSYKDLIEINGVYILSNEINLETVFEKYYISLYNIPEEDCMVHCDISSNTVHIDFEILNESLYGSYLENIPRRSWNYRRRSF